jgi:hypothetical protein
MALIFLLIPVLKVFGSYWKREDKAIELGLSLMFLSSLSKELRNKFSGKFFYLELDEVF